LFEPSSRDLLPAFEQIPSIIPHGDGHFSTAKPFSPTAVASRAQGNPEFRRSVISRHGGVDF
jgi:hypothetical protein